jgi:peptidoglycan/xylan/chitin deacetylase (PgdA/CDA1 family)
MNSISLIKERLRVRSLRYASARIIHILRKYGFSNESLRSELLEFSTILHRHSIIPTFPVTAYVVKRHPTLFKRMQDQGIEFAIHGFRHVDYTLLKSSQIRHHLEEAISIFNRNGLKFSGFRFPFLKRSPQTLAIIGEYPFEWDSSEAISWRLPPDIPIDSLRQHDYYNILSTYNSLPGRLRSLPWMMNRVLEIPVSIPDDDVLAERLGLSGQWISKTWLNILKESRDKGEIFVLQLHPERFLQCRTALQAVIQESCAFQDVWIAPLHQIAQWWKKRQYLSWQLNMISKETFELILKKPGEFQAEIRIPGRGISESHAFSENRPLKIDSKWAPLVGIIPPVQKEVIDILNGEGYLFEEMKSSRPYAVIVHGTLSTDQNSGRLLRQIAEARSPIILISRWPRGYRSAFSVTGDIDGLDFWDYWTRFYGN